MGLIVFSDYPNSVYNSRYESKNGKKNIEPKMGLNSNGKKYAKWWKNDCEYDSKYTHR